MKKLVAGGADVLYAANGITALHAAAQEGEIDVVMELVEFGKCPIDIRGSNRLTPLIVATAMNRLNIVRWLLENGAKPQSANRDGNTALHVAAQENFLPIVEILLTHISHAKYVDKQNEMGVTPLMLAVTSKSRPMVLLLLDAGANPEKRTVPDEEGGFQTPVTLAETFELDAIASDLRRAIAKQTDSLE